MAYEITFPIVFHFSFGSISSYYTANGSKEKRGREVILPLAISCLLRLVLPVLHFVEKLHPSERRANGPENYQGSQPDIKDVLPETYCLSTFFLVCILNCQNKGKTVIPGYDSK